MKVSSYIKKSAYLKVHNAKVLLFLIILCTMCWEMNEPMRQFTADMNYPVSWCIFPFLWTCYPFLTMFWLGVVYINSDVPFFQHMNMYQIIRTGRVRWALGQIGGIFLRAAGVVLVIFLTSVLSLLPRIDWNLDWGKTLYTIGMTNIASAYNMPYDIYYDVLSIYTQISFCLATLAIAVLSVTFIGLMMFLISLYAGRIWAVGCAGAYVLLLFLVINMLPHVRYKMSFFVISVWMQVCKLETPSLGYYWMPPLWYVFGFLLVGIVIMSLMILHRIRKVELNWENQDI